MSAPDSEILFLAHRLPFPPDRGDKIRSHHILKKLADLGPVHVATFADTATDWDHEHLLAQCAASHCLVQRKKPLPLAGTEALLRGEAVSLAAFRDRRIATYVADVLAKRRIAAIYVFSGQMGQYVPASYDGQLVVDLVDVDSAKFAAYARSARWPMNWLHAREEALLRAEEERLAHQADHTLLVSGAEAQLLQGRMAQPSGTHVAALRNGIDADAFDPGKVAPHPALTSANGPHLIFTGQMDYPPNIAAVQRMAHRILPQIRAQIPQAVFHIVGRAPTRDVLELGALENVRVWGEVPDVKPFLASADIVVAPLDIARGVQNKVLEAMAMARPVLITQGAATGIEAENGVHFRVENDDRSFAEAALNLLAQAASAKAMGAAARQFVLDHQSWPAMLANLARIIGLETHHKADAPRNAA